MLWINYFLITVVVAYIQVDGGAGAGAVPMIIGGIIDANTIPIVFDMPPKMMLLLIGKLCLAGAVVGVLLVCMIFRCSTCKFLWHYLTLAEVLSFCPRSEKPNDPCSGSLPGVLL